MLANGNWMESFSDPILFNNWYICEWITGLM